MPENADSVGVDSPTQYEVYRNSMKVATIKRAVDLTKDERKKWVVVTDHHIKQKIGILEHHKFYASIDEALEQYFPAEKLSLFGTSQN